MSHEPKDRERSRAMPGDTTDSSHQITSPIEEQTGQDAAAAGATGPQAARKDPAEGLEDGATIEIDAFGRPAPGGVTVFRKNGKSYIRCLIREKDLRFKPEEAVRQHTLRQVVDQLGYDKAQIRVEVPVQMGSSVHDKPADIIIYADDKRTTPWIVVELKKPKRKDGIDQLKSYMNATGTPLGWWTNGSDNQFLLRTEPNDFSLRLTRVPAAGETLDDIDEPLVRQRLKPVADLLDLLTVCEEEILSHQSVNTFDELFKVIYAKLYDERMNLAKPDDVCQFRVGLTEEPATVAKRINGLYDKACKKWKGVFKEGFELTDQNLTYVVAALQEYEFVGEKSGDVLGVAFEALINPETKGDKGQYFTPRHVIDMCVEMLNPREDEKILDPAAGSSGFLIRAMKRVNDWIDDRFGVDPDKAAEHRKDYAQEMLVGMDNDQRLVRIAKAYMIIENDGRSNIHFADSLDPTSWDGEISKKLDDVDIIMTNPPFAGAIKTTSTLTQYDLTYKGDPATNKPATSMVRAILFLERCLRILRPGGRMAIVLPQGLMNNVNDGYVRDFVDRYARILAVVGLHENTFLPFTKAKTSVMFLEKWQDPADRPDDYEIFFDVSRRPGKNGYGQPIWRPDGSGLDTDVMDIAADFRVWAEEQDFEWAQNT
jgi:type I restriction enzyme M protein